MRAQRWYSSGPRASVQVAAKLWRSRDTGAGVASCCCAGARSWSRSAFSSARDVGRDARRAGAMAYRCDHDSPGCKRAAFGQRVEDESTCQFCRISSAQARDEPGFGMARERLAAKNDQSNVTQRNVTARVAREHRITQFPLPPLLPIPLMILSGTLSTLVKKYATEVIGWGTTRGLLSGPVT
jgi:hypothetical protein